MSRPLPCEGPLVLGDRVFYRQVDKSKIKQGAPSGRWLRAQTIQEGACCVIDTGSTVIRVNQTRLRVKEMPGMMLLFL